jgi:hypothetical protein
MQLATKQEQNDDVELRDLWWWIDQKVIVVQ